MLKKIDTVEGSEKAHNLRTLHTIVKALMGRLGGLVG